MIEEKYPFIKKFNLTVYYTQIGPILVPAEVERILEELDKKIKPKERVPAEGEH